MTHPKANVGEPSSGRWVDARVRAVVREVASLIRGEGRFRPFIYVQLKDRRFGGLATTTRFDTEADAWTWLNEQFPANVGGPLEEVE